MDLSSILGISAAAFMVLLSILLGGASPLIYWDVPSFILVIVGPIAATMFSMNFAHFKALPKAINKVWKNDKTNVLEIINQLVGFSESARKDGLLSLDDTVKDIEDPFLATGVRLMVDGTDPTIIRRILELEIEQLDERHTKIATGLTSLAAYGPAYGMMGTVVGLVAMMANMQDTASIGKGMALALITTLYGSLLANIFALPAFSKLGAKHDVEVMLRTVMMEGVLSIQSGENPRLLEQKLFSFLPPKQRPAAKDVET
jgi:chemotaxis protein MotA